MDNQSKKFNKIINNAKAKIELIKTDFEAVSSTVKSEKTKKKKEKKRTKNNSIFADMDFLRIFSESEIEELTLARKDEKYASLVIELYAVIEQTVKKLYFFFEREVTKREFRQKQKDAGEKNIILFVEEALKEYIDVENNTKLLNDIRSFVVHDEFSFKKAKKKHSTVAKSNKLIEQLLNEANDYINSIKMKD